MQPDLSTSPFRTSLFNHQEAQTGDAPSHPFSPSSGPCFFSSHSPASPLLKSFATRQGDSQTVAGVSEAISTQTASHFSSLQNGHHHKECVNDPAAFFPTVENLSYFSVAPLDEWQTTYLPPPPMNPVGWQNLERFVATCIDEIKHLRAKTRRASVLLLSVVLKRIQQRRAIQLCSTAFSLLKMNDSHLRKDLSGLSSLEFSCKTASMQLSEVLTNRKTDPPHPSQNTTCGLKFVDEVEFEMDEDGFLESVQSKIEELKTFTAAAASSVGNSSSLT